MLQNYVIPELRQRNALNDVVWMQDGALPQKEMSVHWSWNSILVTASSHAIFYFRDLLTSLLRIFGFGDMYLKSRVYWCNPLTLPDLKESIKREAANIPRAVLCSALLSKVSRTQCINCF
ncbi:hypothetical protein TNIN_478661 [Trichonephila inaurata madagascariensis]|uniref:Uncharacterized protein n=1 Tax=Trichonephila inaurata madagascariensis TaxID=2747483 RepID=A0A8X6XQJ9_9ARAC|nr:hypothetical protein TNIN_478661 [Trichonephila inaurata madagascariensis]